MHNGDSSKPADNPNGERPLSRWQRIVAYPKCYFECRRARQKQETPQDRAARRTANATAWIAGFTLVAIVVGTFQFIAMRGQQNVMKRQLDVMEAQNRPWISVEVKSAGELYDIKGAPWGFVEPNYTNVGNAPAGDIWMSAESGAVPISDWMKLIHKAETVRDFCDNWSKGSWIPLHGTGTTLFPGKTTNGAVDVSIKIGDLPPNLRKPRSRFYAYVMGCVTYTFYLSPIRHRTGFMYLVGDSTKKTLGSFVYPELQLGERVSKKDVRVFRIEAGDYAD